MRVPLHIVEARRERLRDMVRVDGSLRLGDICKRLNISEATARRDLEAISANGDITRTYGGALADYNTSFASVDERVTRARSAKADIARAALRRVPATGTLFLDAGTTILALARLIARRRHQSLIVVTNNLSIASVLGGAPGITLHLLGGIFLGRQATLFGDHAVASLSRWHFDAAFLGGEGMDAEGLWNSHAEVVRLQKSVIHRTKAAFFCLDSTKIDHRTPHAIGSWKEAGHLVTDASAARLRAAHIAHPSLQIISVR